MTTKTTTATKKTTKTTAKTGAARAPKKAVVVSEDLPKNPFTFEVLTLVSKQRTKAKKVELLQRYGEPHLKGLFIWNFDESVISLLPEGPVPYSGYKEQTSNSGTLSTKITEEIRKLHDTDSFSLGVAADARQGHTTIRREFKHFYNFLKGGNDAMNSIRRETMFINILEGLHPLEAEIICLVKDKKLQEKYSITKEIVSEAYPEIQWGGRS